MSKPVSVQIRVNVTTNGKCTLQQECCHMRSFWAIVKCILSTLGLFFMGNTTNSAFSRQRLYCINYKKSISFEHNRNSYRFIWEQRYV